MVLPAIMTQQQERKAVSEAREALLDGVDGYRLKRLLRNLYSELDALKKRVEELENAQRKDDNDLNLVAKMGLRHVGLYY